MPDFPKARSIFHRVPPPIWLVGFMVLAWLIAQFVPQANILPDPLRALGYFQIGLGLVLAADVAIRFFRKKTPIHPFAAAKRLVTDGMLRFSRNPIYLGLALILLGYVLLRGSVVGLALIPAFMWALTEFVIKDEEAMLEAEFGDEYRDYKSRVRRWL